MMIENSCKSSKQLPEDIIPKPNNILINNIIPAKYQRKRNVNGCIIHSLSPTKSNRSPKTNQVFFQNAKHRNTTQIFDPLFLSGNMIDPKTNCNNPGNLCSYGQHSIFCKPKARNELIEGLFIKFDPLNKGTLNKKQFTLFIMKMNEIINENEEWPLT